MALCRVVSEIFNVEKCDLEIRLKGQSLKVVPFDWFDGYLSVFSNNFVPKTHRFWDIRFRKMWWRWNQGQRSLKVTRTDTDRSATYDFPINVT